MFSQIVAAILSDVKVACYLIDGLMNLVIYLFHLQHVEKLKQFALKKHKITTDTILYNLSQYDLKKRMRQTFWQNTDAWF